MFNTIINRYRNVRMNEIALREILSILQIYEIKNNNNSRVLTHTKIKTHFFVAKIHYFFVLLRPQVSAF